jgi:two-component system CheB/CheR fusion protein
MIARASDLIDRQVHHMSRLVTDLLDAARAENGQIRLQLARLDLRACIEASVTVLRAAFESKRQALGVRLPESPVWVNGDATRLEQMISNLLSNANKYTPSGGTIDITLILKGANGEAREAVLSVNDNGVGIDAELLPQLFSLFTQADRSLAHSEGGLGIGLSLVRTLVGLHGGSVTARSPGPHRGSTFEVRLPAGDETETSARSTVAANPDSPAIPSSSARRVLVVDDNPDILETSSVLLSMAGHEVKLAATGLEAIDIATRFNPTAVLLDIGLPDLNGYEVAKRLRQMPQFASTLIIAVTGYDTQESRQLSAEAGCDQHLGKPVDFTRVETLLGWVK